MKLSLHRSSAFYRTDFRFLTTKIIHIIAEFTLVQGFSVKKLLDARQREQTVLRMRRKIYDVSTKASLSRVRANFLLQVLLRSNTRENHGMHWYYKYIFVRMRAYTGVCNSLHYLLLFPPFFRRP